MKVPRVSIKSEKKHVPTATVSVTPKSPPSTPTPAKVVSIPSSSKSGEVTPSTSTKVHHSLPQSSVPLVDFHVDGEMKSVSVQIKFYFH